MELLGEAWIHQIILFQEFFLQDNFLAYLVEKRYQKQQINYSFDWWTFHLVKGESAIHRYRQPFFQQQNLKI